MKRLKYFWAGMGGLALGCMTHGTAHAAATVSIAETQPLAFPTLALNGSSTATLTISALTSGTSGTAKIISGTASRGIYALSSLGGGSTSVMISISGITTGNSALTLSNFTGLYSGVTISSFPSTTLPLPAKKPASTPLYIGATVQALPSLPVGSYTMSYTLTVTVL